MMKLISIRDGFATNSSSVHAILRDNGNYWDHEVDQSFGWNAFVCQSREAKECYFAQSMFSSIVSYDTEESEAIKVYEQICRRFPGLEHAVSFSQMKEGYVDHQAHIGMPRLIGTNEPAYDFFAAMVRPIIDGGYVIMGGNDNQEYNEFDDGDQVEFHLLEILKDRNLMLREDSDCYILMDTYGGQKMKFSKDDVDVELSAHEGKSDTPELVDMKITNYCRSYAACSKFCYQGSGYSGAHAALEDIKSCIDECAELGVFEIAIGGGEPTSHPDFKEIIAYAKSKGIVPNFSTRNKEIFKDKELIDAIKASCGGFAFSVSDFKEAIEALALYSNSGLRSMSLQYVLEAYPYKNYLNMIRMIKKFEFQWTPLTLLGYKETGKGASLDRSAFANDDYTQFVKHAKALDIRLSVDTMIASNYRAELEAANIDPRSYYCHEGRHSMYVDLVTKQCGPSSYAVSQMTPWVRGNMGSTFNGY